MMQPAPVASAGSRPEHGLSSPATFFTAIRSLFGTLTPSQVAGVEAKLDAFATFASPIAHVAYGLGTSFWETGRAMQPVVEIGKGRGKAYGKPGKHHGQIAYGRGDVQLTWDYNYQRADDELGLKGALTANYDLALRPDISARIMVRGMTEGWFTDRSFATYLPAKGSATLEQLTQARRIINGTDHAGDVAQAAAAFQSAVLAGGWH